MRYDEYRAHDAVGLADLVARGEVSPAELLEVAIARCEQVDGRINAVVRQMHDSARTRARDQLTGAFAGVPFLIKDLLQDYAGLPTGSGSRALRGQVASQHSASVQRWLDAGLVIFGKTNTPELGAKPVTEPEASGPTRNPWQFERTPGGSSGGSAAAVAAGIVPVAGANDGGGSIRIPAGYCGLFGLKPGRGLVPSGPAHAEYLHGIATDGVVSRSVRDSARMLDVLTGTPDLGGPYLAARPPRSYSELALCTPPTLRIAYSTHSPIGTPVAPDAVAAVENMATALARFGHAVEPAEPNLDGRQIATDFLTMWYAETAWAVRETKRTARVPESRFELDTRLLAAAGEALRTSDYFDAQYRANAYSRALTEFHNHYDLFLTPTSAGPPPRIGELDTPRSLRAVGRTLLRFRLAGAVAKTPAWRRTVVDNLSTVPFTQLANITGRPAMSVPAHRTADGLPIGVHFIGRLGSEPLLLALAHHLESEFPWAHLEPDL
ncbi:amidase [Nocardia cyriacigeorgica]|uniref:amidase n=2 Tax=Nocardia cyriacigeorgica TaxID=135487 RepID=A0A4U8VYJ1_9NOCA|nr:amidase [Nocardia cyriacigeorgica]VFA97795.1 6-aminohexanoate-cyclic-dimer hydrolase [Nocardia cyriacigeorgica]